MSNTVAVWQTTVWILTIVQCWNVSFIKLHMKLDSLSVLVICLCVTYLRHSWTLDIPVQWAALAALWKYMLKWQPFDQLPVQVFSCSAVAGHCHIHGNLYLPTIILLSASELLILSLKESWTLGSETSWGIIVWWANFMVHIPFWEVCSCSASQAIPQITVFTTVCSLDLPAAKWIHPTSSIIFL